MRWCVVLAVWLMALAGAAQAQLLLPKPELRVEKDCPSCPELVILPDGMLMSRAPVMVEEFAAFVAATGYKNRGWGCKWDFPGFEQGPRHPVTCVTFEGAQAYTRWLRESTGKAYRLPTADELAYEVSANQTTIFWWGQQ
ncbi:MAG: SUMF1/EgtB/PvdO family nonheme iron enzyme, partial [Pseudomonadota bacterium]